MKIFYSWQSDTPAKVNRTLIREALDQAVIAVGTQLGLDEAQRPQVDQDTQGVLGSPAIFETILSKIRDADVIVADVTLTGTSARESKRSINSNVAIELGYALGVHGDRVLLKLMNTHFGPANELPFDLRHRRYPVQFELAPDASATTIANAKKQLVDQLVPIFHAYARAESRPAPKHEVIEATTNRACYWREGELLIDEDVGRGVRKPRKLTYDVRSPLVYLRIWPEAPVPKLAASILTNYEVTGIEPFCGGVGTGWSTARNRYGTITYAWNSEDDQLLASTQVFNNGEIWGVASYLIRDREGYPLFLPTAAYERDLRSSLHTYLRFGTEYFGYANLVHVESGVVNPSNCHLAMSERYCDPFWGPIYDDVIVEATLVSGEAESIDSATLSIFESVFEAAGAVRPKNLYGFPAAVES